MSDSHRNASQLAYLIAAEIESSGLSLRQFARKVDVDAGTISRIVNGHRVKIQNITLEKLAAVTDLSVQTLQEAMETPIAQREETSSIGIEGTSILYTAGTIDRCVNDLACEISSHYLDRPFVIICVLSGAWIFVADLVRKIANTNIEVDFIRTTRESPGDLDVSDVQVSSDIRVDITDKEVLVVDDMADTGATLDCITNYLWQKYNPKDVRVCTLLHKIDQHTQRDFLIDFSGLQSTTRFVVGYGMDDDLGTRQFYRNVPDILRLNAPEKVNIRQNVGD